MKIYLVGGAIRDELLGLPVKEKDWVVVGATVDDMLKLGFRPVGKDFPVFLHPETNEEYALARTERKVGRGYTGFNFNTSPDVTLEEDLKRRDLTINAIAREEPGGALIDPFHGENDLQKKLLRHVSPAFVEDPVRILRVARFAARFADFTIAAETNALMKQMVLLGEVDALVAERVWKELERALAEKRPQRFFQVLKDCEALSKLFPQINELGQQALKKAADISSDSQVRFAALLYNVSTDDIKQLCERYRASSQYRELALLVSRYFESFRKAVESDAKEIVDLLQSVDAFRREDRFFNFLRTCEAVDAGFPYQKWVDYLQASSVVDVTTLISKGFSNQELAKEIKNERIKLIEISLKNFKK